MRSSDHILSGTIESKLHMYRWMQSRTSRLRPSRIARISPGEPLHYREMDIQWLMDWYQVQEKGATVFGAPPQHYIPYISTEEFIVSLKNCLPS